MKQIKKGVKEDNEWYLEQSRKSCVKRFLYINGETYDIPEDKAALCHSILLLVDAINDKSSK